MPKVRRMVHSRRVFNGSWASVVAGVLAAVLPFVLDPGPSEGALRNNVVTGLLVALVAGYNAWRAARADHEPSALLPWANVLLGIWLAVSPFVYAAPLPFAAADLVLGAVVAVAGTVNGWFASPDARASRLSREGL